MSNDNFQIGSISVFDGENLGNFLNSIELEFQKQGWEASIMTETPEERIFSKKEIFGIPIKGSIS